MIKDKAILYLALGQTFLWAGLFYSFPALFLRWEQAFQWSKPEITGAITIAILISALFSPLAGRIIDKGNGAVMMFSAAILGGICLICLSFVTELRFFYLCWALTGICMAGCLYDPCFALITRNRGAQAKRGIILVTLLAGFAGTISFPLAYNISEFSNWNNALRIFAFIIVVIAAPMTLIGATMIEKSVSLRPISNQTRISTNRRQFLMRPDFWFLALAFAMIALLHGTIIHHLLPLLNDRGVNAGIAVIAVSFIGPMQIMGRLAMMTFEKQTSNHQITISCYVTTGCAISLLYYSGYSVTLLISFVILFGTSYGVVSILRPVVARDLLGEHNIGTKLGVLSSVYLSGSAIAPYLGSVLWKIGGYDLVLIILTGFALFGLGLYLLANKLSNH